VAMQVIACKIDHARFAVIVRCMQSCWCEGLVATMADSEDQHMWKGACDVTCEMRVSYRIAAARIRFSFVLKMSLLPLPECISRYGPGPVLSQLPSALPFASMTKKGYRVDAVGVDRVDCIEALFGERIRLQHLACFLAVQASELSTLQQHRH